MIYFILILLFLIVLFLYLLKNNERFDNIKDTKFITSNRFDLMAKFLYIKYKDKNINTNFYINLYRNHILAFNDCKESYIELPNKTNCLEFINRFDNLINSIKKNGFSNKHSIPVGKNNMITNGSHRLMTSYYLNIKPNIKLVNENGSEAWNYDYFINKTPYKKLKNIYSDTMALEYIKHNEHIRLMVLFPSAYNLSNSKKIYSIIKKYGYLYYEKKIEFKNLNGLNNFVNECYRGESWIGGLFPPNNINNKTQNVKSHINNKIKIFLIDMNNIDKCIELKNECRKLFNIGKHSIHMSDFKKDTYRISSAVLNKNSIHFLNNGINNISTKSKELLETYFNYIKNNEDYCVTSSFVMELYNLRKANDLDYLNFSNNIINIKNINIHNNKWLKYYHVHRDEIIYNPNYYFYFNGHKFASLEVIKIMKEQRKENKDIKDIKLIKIL